MYKCVEFYCIMNTNFISINFVENLNVQISIHRALSSNDGLENNLVSVRI